MRIPFQFLLISARSLRVFLFRSVLSKRILRGCDMNFVLEGSVRWIVRSDLPPQFRRVRFCILPVSFGTMLRGLCPIWNLLVFRFFFGPTVLCHFGSPYQFVNVDLVFSLLILPESFVPLFRCEHPFPSDVGSYNSDCAMFFVLVRIIKQARTETFSLVCNLSVNDL